MCLVRNFEYDLYALTKCRGRL